MELFYSQGLKIKFPTGQYDENDKEIWKSKTYSNVKDGVTGDNLWTVGNAIMGLAIENPSSAKYFRVKVTEISE